MLSRKYNRTYHLPFSEGVTSDDKICHDWEGVLEQPMVVSEKLDGENTCLKTRGVFARSHVSPTKNPWARNMWAIWERLKGDLGNLEVFGENLYGIHSIEYDCLLYHFYVFAIREEERWLSWEEVLFYAELFELPTVPVLENCQMDEAKLRSLIDKRMEAGSVFGGDCEGVVLRNATAFENKDFKHNVLKYVRANHVKTDEHWTRHWKRALLWFEKNHG